MFRSRRIRQHGKPDNPRSRSGNSLENSSGVHCPDGECCCYEQSSREAAEERDQEGDFSTVRFVGEVPDYGR